MKLKHLFWSSAVCMIISSLSVVLMPFGDLLLLFLSFHMHYLLNGKVFAYIGKEKSHKEEIREEKHEKQKI